MDDEKPTRSHPEPLYTPVAFPRFSELPPELRIKIWQDSMPDARTIVIQSPPHKHQPKSLDDALSHACEDGDQGETWRSTTQIPAHLHVNGEARHESLKHYRLAFGVGTHQPRIYVDFSRDTILIGDSELTPECSKLWASTADLVRIQRLAIVPEGAWRLLRCAKGSLNEIRKITFVHESEKAGSVSPLRLVEDVPQEVDASDVEAQLAQNLEVQQEEGEASPETEGAQQQNENTLKASLEICLTKYHLDPMKQRIQAAREELDTLMQVLSTQWEKEPMISTAVLRSTAELVC